jgi:hypothetical protein
VKLVPLLQPDADAAIASVPEAERTKTILMLDAFDEDAKAIQNHKTRLEALLALSHKYRAVLITCRSQFFPKEEEILVDTGLMRTAPADGSKVYTLQKNYLSPFTDDQVQQYLRRRFPWWRRPAVQDAVSRIPDLVARPLLLTYVEDLTTARGIQFAHQMYEIVVQRWCEREKGFADPEKIREFSECLAEEIFLTRGGRQMERIPGEEIRPLARKYGIALVRLEVAGAVTAEPGCAGEFQVFAPVDSGVSVRQAVLAGFSAGA